MSDVKPAHHITSTMLPDGTTIHINDHVYLTPEHLGEPYYIGRVMEFCTSHKRKGLQARIAWFNRPKDVINRKSADPCLLVATMHSDINPVSSIRGKCTVIHKYYIPQDQMDIYRKTEDNFYYNQLYDRYIQRVYDVVPCETVQNVPMDTLEALKQRYQFIVVEQGKAADLTVARRMCCVCQEWCQSAVSVKCAACQKSYHMACLNPPLARKPSKGFAWQCAFCTRQEALSNPQSPTTSSSNAASPAHEKINDTKPHASSTNKTEAKRQTRSTRSQVSRLQQAQQQGAKPISCLGSSSSLSDTHNALKNTGLKSQQIKMTHMWPFRYFGVNTNIRDILDVDDRIYPRAKSRIGTKYQANMPGMDPNGSRSLSPASDVASSSSKSKKYEKKKLQKSNSNQSNGKKSVEASPKESMSDMEEPIPVRGGDDTVTCLYRPGILNEEQVDDYMNQVKQLQHLPLPSYSPDLLDRALLELELNSYHTDIAYEHMCHLTKEDFKHVVEWTPKEIEAFEQSIREHGHDLNYAKNSVKTKPMADIVRYFYQWKKTDRYEPVYSEWTKIYRPLKRFKKFPRQEEEHKEEEEDHSKAMTTEEEDPTIVPRNTYDRGYQCMNCLTVESHTWRRSPSDIDRKRQVFNKVLCNDCGVFWLKYAKTKPISPEIRIANISAQQAASDVKYEDDKRRKRPSDFVPSRPSKKTKDEKLTLRFIPSACQICLNMTPDIRLYTCYDCGMSVHNDCYGISQKDKQGWRCDPCDNKHKPVSSYVYECVLCFNSEAKHQPLKCTAGYYWAHVQCAMFIPEVKFVHPSLLSPVEYISCVNMARLNADCDLCSDKRGACVACSECQKTVHVQCAIHHQFKLAFEIQPNKMEKYPTVPAGLFGSSPSGLMVPQVWCPSHSLSDKQLIELDTRTTDEAKESALIVYAKTYKGVAKGTTPAMRRFRATWHASSKITPCSTKIPDPREAAIEALTMDDSPSPLPSPIKISISFTNTNRVCATEGCE
ncbi:putative PHD type zinc finger protein with BAH domain-containing protein, partial [Rhizopus stolonifer]